MKRKITALITVIVFFTTSVNWNLPLSFAEPVAVLPSLPAPSLIQIPHELGSVESTYAGNPNLPKVILVQDAHAVISAQLNIQNLISYFRQKYGVEKVAVEGAEGALDSVLLRAFPDEIVKRKVLEEYLNRGELSGAGLAAIMNPVVSHFAGIENWQFYEENYLAYARAYQQTSKVRPVFEALITRMDSRRAKVFSPGLNQLHKNAQDFWDEKTDLPRFFKFLSTVKEGRDLLETGKYQKVSAFALLLASEEKDDSNSLELSVKEMALSFKEQKLKSVSKEEEIEFNKRFHAYRTGSMDAKTFLQFLVEFGERLGFKPRLTASMRAALGDVQVLSAIKGTQLFKELEAFLDELNYLLAKSPEAKELVEEYKKTRLLKDLYRLELTREKLTLYQKSPANYLALLGEKKDLLTPALDFYRLALKRDEIFHQNLSRIFYQKKNGSVLVLAGGFHTEGLEANLRKDGISYAVVTPKIESLAGHENYAGLMMGDLSYKKHLRTTFYDAFARDVTVKLVEKLGADDFRKNIKVWRDEVIRLLAKEGRVADASLYTDYIDLLFKIYYEKFGDQGPGPSREDLLKAIDDGLQNFRQQKKSQVWEELQNQTGFLIRGIQELSAKKQLSLESVNGLLNQSGEAAVSGVVPVSNAVFSRDYAPRAEMRSLIESQVPPASTGMVLPLGAAIEGAFENLGTTASVSVAKAPELFTPEELMAEIESSWIKNILEKHLRGENFRRERPLNTFLNIEILPGTPVVLDFQKAVIGGATESLGTFSIVVDEDKVTSLRTGGVKIGGASEDRQQFHKELLRIILKLLKQKGFSSVAFEQGVRDGTPSPWIPNFTKELLQPRNLSEGEIANKLTAFAMEYTDRHPESSMEKPGLVVPLVEVDLNTPFVLTLIRSELRSQARPGDVTDEAPKQSEVGSWNDVGLAGFSDIQNFAQNYHPPVGESGKDASKANIYSAAQMIAKELPASVKTLQTILDMRRWMDAAGQEEKPLVLLQNLRLGEFYPLLTPDMKLRMGMLDISSAEIAAGGISWKTADRPRFILIKHKIPSSEVPLRENEKIFLNQLGKVMKEIQSPIVMIDHSENRISKAQWLALQFDLEEDSPWKDITRHALSEGVSESLFTAHLKTHETPLILLNPTMITPSTLGRVSLFDDSVFLHEGPQSPQVVIAGKVQDVRTTLHALYAGAMEAAALPLIEGMGELVDPVSRAEVRANDSPGFPEWSEVSPLTESTLFRPPSSYLRENRSLDTTASDMIRSYLKHELKWKNVESIIINAVGEGAHFRVYEVIRKVHGKHGKHERHKDVFKINIPRTHAEVEDGGPDLEHLEEFIKNDIGPEWAVDTEVITDKIPVEDRKPGHVLIRQRRGKPTIDSFEEALNENPPNVKEVISVFHHLLQLYDGLLTQKRIFVVDATLENALVVWAREAAEIPVVGPVAKPKRVKRTKLSDFERAIKLSPDGEYQKDLDKGVPKDKVRRITQKPGNILNFFRVLWPVLIYWKDKDPTKRQISELMIKKLGDWAEDKEHPLPLAGFLHRLVDPENDGEHTLDVLKEYFTSREIDTAHRVRKAWYADPKTKTGLSSRTRMRITREILALLRHKKEPVKEEPMKAPVVSPENQIAVETLQSVATAMRNWAIAKTISPELFQNFEPINRAVAVLEENKPELAVEGLSQYVLDMDRVVDEEGIKFPSGDDYLEEIGGVINRLRRFAITPRSEIRLIVEAEELLIWVEKDASLEMLKENLGRLAGGQRDRFDVWLGGILAALSAHLKTQPAKDILIGRDSKKWMDAEMGRAEDAALRNQILQTLRSIVAQTLVTGEPITTAGLDEELKFEGLSSEALVLLDNPRILSQLLNAEYAGQFNQSETVLIYTGFLDAQKTGIVDQDIKTFFEQGIADGERFALAYDSEMPGETKLSHQLVKTFREVMAFAYSTQKPLSSTKVQVAGRRGAIFGLLKDKSPGLASMDGMNAQLLYSSEGPVDSGVRALGWKRFMNLAELLLWKSQDIKGKNARHVLDQSALNEAIRFINSLAQEAISRQLISRAA